MIALFWIQNGKNYTYASQKDGRDSINTTDLMWEFFEQNVRAPTP